MCRGPPPAGRMPFMSDSTLIRRSAALRGLKPLTKLPTGNGENVRKFQICLARLGFACGGLLRDGQVLQETMNRNRGRKIVDGIRTGLSDVETGPDELI